MSSSDEDDVPLAQLQPKKSVKRKVESDEDDDDDFEAKPRTASARKAPVSYKDEDDSDDDDDEDDFEEPDSKKVRRRGAQKMMASGQRDAGRGGLEPLRGTGQLQRRLSVPFIPRGRVATLQ